jgi:hypothetical protein
LQSEEKIMARHSMKSGGSSQGGTLNSRHITQKSGAVGNHTQGSPSLKNINKGLGSGDANTRYSSTKPSGDSGRKGLAQPLDKAPAHKVNTGTNIIGNVYTSTKPSSR